MTAQVIWQLRASRPDSRAHPAGICGWTAKMLTTLPESGSIVAAAVRWSLASVIFDYGQDALIVHNPLRVHTIAFSDIYGFERVNHWIPGGNGAIRELVKVTRTDRKRTTLVGACAFGDTSVAKMISQLDRAF